MPDKDIDLDSLRRDEVIDYVSDSGVPDYSGV